MDEEICVWTFYNINYKYNFHFKNTIFSHCDWHVLPECLETFEYLHEINNNWWKSNNKPQKKIYIKMYTNENNQVFQAGCFILNLK